MLPFTEDSPAFSGRVGVVLGRDILGRKESEEATEPVLKLLSRRMVQRTGGGH